MHIVPGFILREVAGEIIAIPSGEAAASLSGLVALNSSGKLLFDLLQSEQTEQSLTQAMLEAYDIDCATAQADVQEFLEVFRKSGILVED
ncbi:MAG: PqqD family protein [Ruminococcus sp.]|nr:PqqD family protein [Ruminococcus sp.]